MPLRMSPDPSSQRPGAALALLLALALAGCGGPPTAATRPPLASETPPTTKDPGAVLDEPSL